MPWPHKGDRGFVILCVMILPFLAIALSIPFEGTQCYGKSHSKRIPYIYMYASAIPCPTAIRGNDATHWLTPCKDQSHWPQVFHFASKLFVQLFRATHPVLQLHDGCQRGHFCTSGCILHNKKWLYTAPFAIYSHCWKIAGAGFEPTTFGLWDSDFGDFTSKIQQFTPKTAIFCALALIVFYT